MQNQDIIHEAVVPFSDGKKLLPRAPSKSTLDRWARKGVTAGSYGRVTLEWCYAGSVRVTSMEAYLRFNEKINEGRRLANEQREQEQNV
ncbi:MAG: hypothetical protein ACYSWU_25635 [Planctomycetota bacterium]|jgi:hypothetical protein